MHVGSFIGQDLAKVDGPPLPAGTTHAWWCERLLTNAAWTDYVSGLTVPAINAPVVAPDPGYFNGKMVAHSAITGSRAWRAIGRTGLPATGSRPYELLVARYDNFQSGNQTLIGFGGASTTYWLRANGSNSNRLECSQPSTAVTVVGPVADGNVHVFERWCDGAKAYLRVDGLSFEANTTAALATDTTYVSFGSTGTSANLANARFAFRIICSAKPSEESIARLVSWLESRFGL